MSVHALIQFDPTQFFRTPSTNGAGINLNEEEVKDLARLFRNIANIFTHYFTHYLSDQDDGALAGTTALAEPVGALPSLSDLDLSVEVGRERSRVARLRRLRRSRNRQPVPRRPPRYRPCHLLRIPPPALASVPQHKKHRNLSRWCSKS